MAKRKKSWVRRGIEMYTRDVGKRYRARFKMDGRVITGQSFATEKEARADLARLRANLDDLPTGEILTVGDAMALVVENLKKKGRRPGTFAAYAAKFDIIRETFRADLPLAKIKAEHIDSYAVRRMKGYESGEDKRLPVRAATVRGELRHFNRCFTIAMRRGAIKVNPIDMAKDDLPDPDKPRRDWFEMTEFEHVLRKVGKWKHTERLHPKRDALLMRFMALSGVRKRELAALLVRHVNIRKGIVEIHEGKRGHRDIPFDKVPGLEAVVLALLDGRARFRARQDDRLLPISYEGIGSMMRRWSKRLKEPRLHPHAMRHTFLTEVAKRTCSPFAVMRLGGIKAVTTAMIYVHEAGVDESGGHVSDAPRVGTR